MAQSEVSGEMLDFGLHLLARSILDVTYAQIQQPYVHAMGVVRCAHAAEIVFKAAIAEGDPLLICTKVPPPVHGISQDFRSILTDPRTRTIGYGDLPDKLKDVTGYEIENRHCYMEFGALRNKIVHLGIGQFGEYTDEVYRFAYTVVLPMIRHFWDGSFAEYFGAYEDEGSEHVQEVLDRMSF